MIYNEYKKGLNKIMDKILKDMYIEKYKE